MDWVDAATLEQAKKLILTGYPEVPFDPDSALANLARDYERRNVLDFGCGLGRNLKPFIEAGCFCFGYDFPNMLQLARTFLGADSRKVTWIPFGALAEYPALFDLIIAEIVFQHLTVEHLYEALHLIRQKMRRDGCLYVCSRGYMDCGGGSVWQHVLTVFTPAKCGFNDGFNGLDDSENHQKVLLQVKNDGAP